MKRNATNQILQKAKASKSDEFYTQLIDIARELQHYEKCFQDKVVYCNCDDPRTSNFFKYFKINFQRLGLKKLIASCYMGTKLDLFQASYSEPGLFCEYLGDQKDCTIKQFKEDGDFRSKESIELLKKSDIIVSNPPFSLFREYIAQLVKYDKKFLVIGNINAITYQEIFHLIQDNKVWLGVNLGRGISGFIVPAHYKLYGTEISRDVDGNAIVATNNCLWLTNLDTKQRHNDIALTKSYVENPSEYLKYDNCDGINVNKTQEIPCDYEGLMGVPITFLHKYNPEQFEIVRFRKGDDGRDLSINGKCPYFRILIKNRKIKQHCINKS